MTIVNIHMKEEEKKKLQYFIDSNNMKSISDFVRKTILEKIKIEEIMKKDQNVQDIKTPDYIPKNKYVVFVNGAIIGVGDSPSEVSLIAVQKFPNLPFFIEFNGVKNDKKIEYCFMSFSDFQGWKYSRLYTYSYPILPLNISHKGGKAIINASIDTASTLCVLKNNLIIKENFEKTRIQDIYTAGGIITGEIYC